MKKFFLPLFVLPVLSFATDLPAGMTVTSAVQAGARPRNCMQSSDRACYGRAAYGTCLPPEAPNRTGICQPTSAPDGTGDVSCACQ